MGGNANPLDTLAKNIDPVIRSATDSLQKDPTGITQAAEASGFDPLAIALTGGPGSPLTDPVTRWFADETGQNLDHLAFGYVNPTPITEWVQEGLGVNQPRDVEIRQHKTAEEIAQEEAAAVAVNQRQAAMDRFYKLLGGGKDDAGNWTGNDRF